ncbi:MAG: tRNA (N6-isopentenyl adenosine(37)-C2)-methylthiotransferase MiaB [Candidatus Omnitrophota bacterium]|nr:tRNA (N6-isopentenyl adenosine(37)-C2)-methylthiotransferase MiaB [Candidatus Omnitrophota bacterium]
MNVFVETYGCQMNEYDTELIRAILGKEGFAFIKDELAADVVMLNTCAIRENAHRKVYGRVHEIHHAREGKPVLVGILGCMATNLRKELFENRGLKIDFIAGPDSYKHLPDLIRTAAATGEKPFDLTLSEFETYSDVYPAREKGVNAWIAVMRGCNNFCTFCVVPYTRGRERSRTVENVVGEAARLAAEGFRQITLLGQNVNSYHSEGKDFADLLEAVSRVKGIERIRFTSPHPKDFPDRVLDVVANNPKVCKQIHLPLQAGNNRVLGLMDRTYTKEEFLELAAKIKAKIPGVTLSTDVIAGFPTETDAEFEETLDVLEQIRFHSAFTFKYSERKGTIASRQHPDDVPEAIKTERAVRLTDIQRRITLERNKEHVGRTQPVMIEAIGTAKSGEETQGRTDGNTIVILPGTGYTPGEIIPVRITAATVSVLKGEAATEAACPA